MKAIIFTGGLGVALILTGCGSGGGGAYKPKPAPKVETVEVKAGEEKSLMPVAKGSQWVYAVNFRMQQRGGQTGEQNGDVTFRITETEPQGDGTKASFVTVNTDGKQGETQTWLIDSTGIYQLTGGMEKEDFVPPLPNVAFPIKVGETFKWKGKGPFPGGLKGEATATSKVVGYQEVDTEMGRMSALAIENRTEWTTSDDKKAISAGMTWWRPNYGFVRIRQEVLVGDTVAVQLFKLKSYTPGK